MGTAATSAEAHEANAAKTSALPRCIFVDVRFRVLRIEDVFRMTVMMRCCSDDANESVIWEVITSVMFCVKNENTQRLSLGKGCRVGGHVDPPLCHKLSEEGRYGIYRRFATAQCTCDLNGNF